MRITVFNYRVYFRSSWRIADKLTAIFSQNVLENHHAWTFLKTTFKILRKFISKLFEKNTEYFADLKSSPARGYISGVMCITKTLLIYTYLKVKMELRSVLIITEKLIMAFWFLTTISIDFELNDINRTE